MSDVIDLPSKNKPTAMNTFTWLPVTEQQFENFVNEILLHINTQIVKNGALEANYMSQVITSVIHGLDKAHGKVRKDTIVERCVSIISRHVSYHITNELQKKLKAEKDALGNATNETVPMEPAAQSISPELDLNEPLPDEVRGELPPIHPTVA